MVEGGASTMPLLQGSEKPCVLLLFDPSPYLPGLLSSLERSFRVELHDQGKILVDRVSLDPAVAARVQALVGMVASSHLIDSLHNLRMISCVSAGLDLLDLDACRLRSIAVSSIPSVSDDDVADLGILFMLAASRRLCASHQFVRQGLWNTGVDPGLATKASGRKVGIIGLGSIGACIAKRAAAFGCSISYNGRSPKPSVPYTYYGNLVDMARACTVLFISCALTKDTLHMVDREVLDALGSGGILVNIARGQIVREADLIAALKDGSLGFAALDVFENEPHINPELRRLHNVILTPHMGSGTTETRAAIVRLVVENLEAFFSGNPLLTPVLDSRCL